jgi:hypothetical protein
MMVQAPVRRSLRYVLLLSLLLLVGIPSAPIGRTAHGAELQSGSDDRFHIEDALVDGFVSYVAERWPYEFAGLWIGDSEPPLVYVAFTSRSREFVDILAERFPVRNALRPVYHRYSLAELEAMQTRMIADRTSLQQRGAEQLPDGILRTEGRYDLDIDVSANKVVVHLPQTDDGIIAAFLRHYPSHMLSFREGVVEPDCTRTNCGRSMRGGLQITTPHEDLGYLYVCSSAFGTYQGSGLTRVYQVLTAGHCGDGGPQVWSHAMNPYGFAGYYDSRTYGSLDAKVIANDNPLFATTNLVFVTSGDQRPMNGFVRWSDIALGVTVTKSGVTTGSTSGSIESKNYSPSYILNGEKFVKATYCSEGGDSGGAVFRSNTAYGIHSGGPTLTCASTGDFGIFGAVEFALNAFWVNLLTN